MVDQVHFTFKGKANTRLDKALRQQYPDWGRSAVGRIINARQVNVNSKTVWLASWKLHPGDQISVSNPPAARPQGPEFFNPAWVIADHGDVLAVNKPAGLRSQAARAGREDNLLDLARAQYGEVSLFHRLDRDTSGVVLFTRNQPGINAYLDHAFQNQLIEKEYLAFVSGGLNLPPDGVIHTYLDRHEKRRDMIRGVERGGQPATTRVELLGSSGNYHALRLFPLTGRTHQLRVQLANLGMPVLGDMLYGDAHSAARLLLHARQISLPKSEGFPARVFAAPVGEDYRAAMPSGFQAKLD